MNSRLTQFTTALALGLLMAIALIFFLTTGIAIGATLQDNQGDGSIIKPTQTVDGIWGPGVITATSDVTINPTVVITVAANTTVVVADGKGFTVLGNLHSDGPVTFTTATSPAIPGAWKGITFTTGSRGYFNQATIEYAERALVLSTTNPITISNSTIRYNKHAPAAGVDAFGAGIAIVSGAHLVTNTQVYGNILVSTGAGGDAFGGGIDIQGSGSQIINSAIYSNQITSTLAFAIGGGIAIRGSGNATLIEGSRVTSNTLRALGVDGVNTYGEGGGIGFPAGSNTSAVIRNNWIAGNINRSVTANGGGIGLSGDAQANLIERNVIYNNLSESPGADNNYWAEGGGIDTWGGNNQVTITNNLILSNTVRCVGACYANTGPVGGAIMVNGMSAARPTIVVNNTIVGNRAEGLAGGGYAGAIGAQTNGVFANNIIASNSCTAGGCGGAFYWWASVSVDYGDLWNNSPNDYAGNIASLRPNDIAQDPLFVGSGNLAQQYHIRQGRPAIDKGTSANAPNYDYDNQPRPMGAAWDIGFSEVRPFTYTKSVNLGTARPNDTLVYTIVVTNPDPIATFVRGIITDGLPLNTHYNSGPNCNVGACGYDSATNAITWTGDIATNSALNLNFAVLVNSILTAGTSITNTALVTVGAISKTTSAVTLVYGNVYTWTGSASSAWNSNSNWSSNVVPGSLDDVIIPPSAVPNWPIVNVTSAVHNLTIRAGALLTVSNPLTVTGVVSNSGWMYQTRPVNGINTGVDFLRLQDTASNDKYRGLTITPTVSGLGNVTVTIKGNQPCGTLGTLPQTVLRCYEIAPQNPATATIQLFYTAAEANNNTAPNVYHWNTGTLTWTVLSSTHGGSGEALWVQASANAYSPFALKGNAPTAITLTSQRAVSRVSNSPLLAGLLVVSGAAIAAWRKARTRKLRHSERTPRPCSGEKAD